MSFEGSSKSKAIDAIGQYASSSRVSVRLVQGVDLGNSPDERMGRMRNMILNNFGSIQSRDYTSDVVILPEMWPIGFFNFDGYISFAKESFSEYLALLRELADALRCWCFGGSAPYMEGSSIYNRSVVVSPFGDEYHFDKLHLFPYKSREPEILSRGRQLVMFDSPLGRTGLLTCFDLRFPECFRALRGRGCEVFVVVAAWPKPRLAHWTALLSARAIENQAWVIGVNGQGYDFGVELGGGSMVVAPDGAVVMHMGDEPYSPSVSISCDLPRRVREELPFNDSTIPELLGNMQDFPVVIGLQ